MTDIVRPRVARTRADDDVSLEIIVLRHAKWKWAQIARKFGKTTAWAKNTYDRIAAEDVGEEPSAAPFWGGVASGAFTPGCERGAA